VVALLIDKAAGETGLPQRRDRNPENGRNVCLYGMQWHRVTGCCCHRLHMMIERRRQRTKARVWWERGWEREKFPSHLMFDVKGDLTVWPPFVVDSLLWS
jgi:hypothetical protein